MRSGRDVNLDGERNPNGKVLPDGNVSRQEVPSRKYQKINRKPTRAVRGARISEGFW